MDTGLLIEHLACSPVAHSIGHACEGVESSIDLHLFVIVSKSVSSGRTQQREVIARSKLVVSERWGSEIEEHQSVADRPSTLGINR